MELLTWTSVINLAQEARRPFNYLKKKNKREKERKHVINRLPLEPARPCPDPRPLTPPQLKFAVCPAGPHSDTGWGRIVDICPNKPNPPGGRASWRASQSACPPAFTVVWLTVGLLVGYTDLRGSSGWILFWWMYSSQWTAAIYNLISKDHIHWFLLFSTPSPQPLDHWRHFHIVPNGSKYSQVMFTLMDGAQTLSRFCLFAVLYFIVFVIIIIIVVVVVFF